MLVTKYYQTSTRLQAIYAASNTTSKLFLSISKRCNPDRWSWIHRAPLADEVGISERHVNRLSGKLQEFGVLEKVVHSTNKSHPSAYRITPLGYEVMHIFQQIYKINKYLILTVSLLFSPVNINVPLLSLKDNSYTESTDCSSGNLSLKLYSIYAETRERREFLPYHHWPTENREYRDQKRPTTKKESSVDQPSWVTPTLNAATKALNLNKWGQIRLSAYPDLAIVHALNVFKSSKSAKQDLFKWFSSVCNEWCKKNNAAPEWGKMHRLAVDNNMPDNPSLILEGKALVIPAAKVVSKNSRQQELMAIERAKSQRRISLNTQEDIDCEKRYLAKNPGWVDIGERLGVDMSRWDLTQKVVTELKDQIVCAQIEHDEVVWENLKYSPIDGDELYDEIY